MTDPSSARETFYGQVLAKLLRNGALDPSDAVLVVCAGEVDKAELENAGFKNVTISNLAPQGGGENLLPYSWSQQDAENIGFADESFDFVFVHWGLHHCNSPHRAVLEMYRVCRKGLLIFEPLDNLMTRLGTTLGLGQEYETDAVFQNRYKSGGVRDTQIPNYVYRFGVREVQKTVNSFAPHAKHRFQIFYETGMGAGVSHRRNRLRYFALKATMPFLRLAKVVLPSQFSNRFAILVLRPKLPRDLHPWLTMENERISVNRAELEKLYISDDS